MNNFTIFIATPPLLYFSSKINCLGDLLLGLYPVPILSLGGECASLPTLLPGDTRIVSGTVMTRKLWNIKMSFSNTLVYLMFLQRK